MAAGGDSLGTVLHDIFECWDNKWIFLSVNKIHVHSRLFNCLFLLKNMQTWEQSSKQW